MFLEGNSRRLTGSKDSLKRSFFELDSKRALATLLNVQYERFMYHLSVKGQSRAYIKFTIPKRNGSPREITAPSSALKIIQSKLNTLLQACYDTKAPVHGFIPDRHILSNALRHRRKNWVLNVDLKNFFPSINFGRVRGMFLARPYRRNAEVATHLAKICCYEGKLPQGAPSSPIVSNMVCARLDGHLQMLARNYRCFYTRYGDDITISTSLERFPPEIASVNGEGLERTVRLGRALRKIIHTNGFQINESKSRLQRWHARQEVTGLVVNKFPNVKRTFVRQVRAMLHAWQKFGPDAAANEYSTKYDKRRKTPPEDRSEHFKRVVKGKIEFIGWVRSPKDPLYLKLRATFDRLAPELASTNSAETELENIKRSMWVLETLVGDDIRQGTAF